MADFEICCVEAGIQNLALGVGYTGDPALAPYNIANVEITISNHNPTGGTNGYGSADCSWKIPISADATPSLPNGVYQLGMSCTFSGFGFTNYAGGTWSGPANNGDIEWTSAPSTMTLEGTIAVDFGDLPQVMTLQFKDGSELNVFFVSDCMGGNPGPVTHVPPTPPEPCNDSGDGDGDGGTDGCGGDDDDDCGSDCDEGGSGPGSVPGKSAVCPIPEMQSFGAREDYSASPCDTPGIQECSSCNGSGPPWTLPTNPERPVIDIRRRLTPQELTNHSSFGLGWYAETDYSIEFYPETADDPNTILFFDPLTERVFEMVDDDSGTEDGIYNHASGAKFFDSFELYSDSGYQNLTTDPLGVGALHSGGGNYLYGKLTRRNGWIYKFEVIDVSPFPGTKIPQGRLISITSPEGFSKTFSYVSTYTQAELEMFPQRLMQIDTVTDSYSNVAQYNYEPDPRAGRYVVSQIDIDIDSNGTFAADESLIYEYDIATDRLWKVSRDANPNPILMSEYTYSQDENAGTDMIEWEEMDEDCPQENDTAILSTDSIVWDGDLINQFAARLLGRKDGNNYQYMTVYRGDPEVPAEANVYRIEYRGMLIDWSVGQYSKYYENWDIENNTEGFDKFIELDQEDTFPINIAANPDDLEMAQPDSCEDETGYDVTLSFEDDNLSVVTHPIQGALPNNPYEKFQYNSRNELIMYRDREGYATVYDYDSAGNLIRIGRGYEDSATSSAATNYDPQKGTITVSGITGESTVEEFYYNGNGLLQSSGIAYYPATGGIPATEQTEYTYYSDGRIKEVKKPIPAGSVSTRPTITLHWVNGRLDKVTDELGDDIEFDYDELDRVVKMTYEDNSTEETWYDDARNRVYSKDRNNIVSYVERDGVGRVKIVAQGYAVDTDGDLSNDVWAVEQFDPNNRVTNMGAATYTRNYYLPGQVQPYRIQSNRRTTNFAYDYRGRQSTITRSIGPTKPDVRTTEYDYVDNRLFRTREKFTNGTHQFTRQTYRGYSDDSTNVRIIECRDDTTTYATNTAVMTALRPTNLSDPSNDLRIIDRITDMRGANMRVVDERDVITDYDVDAHGRTTQMDQNLLENGGTEPHQLTTTTQYDYRDNVTSTTDPLGNTTEMVYDDGGNLKTRTLAKNVSGIQMSYSYEYDEKYRRKTETLPSSGVNESFYSDCCGRQRGYRNAEGEQRVTVMNSGGQVVYEAAVATTYDLATGTYTAIDVSKRLSETTRRYDDVGRLQFKTIWTQPISGPSLNPASPPIARDGNMTDGVTTQYAYINQVFAGFGGATSITVDRLQTASTTDSFAIDLGNAITQLQTYGLGFTTSRPGSAHIVIAPDERVYSYTLVDSLGRTVMAGTNYGPAATDAGASLNGLIDWQITKYDESDTEQGFPVEVVTSTAVDGYQTKSLRDAFGWTLASEQIESIPARTNETLTEYDVSGNPLKVTVVNPTTTPNPEGDSVTEYEYDEIGRQIEIAVKHTTAGPDSVSATSYFEHGAGNSTRPGLIKQSVDANGNVINYQESDYDVLGRLLNVRDRMDAVHSDNFTQQVYNDEGNLIQLIDAEGNMTDYEYDLLGRKTLTTYQDGRQVSVAYDQRGNIESAHMLGTGELTTEGLKREYDYEYSGVTKDITFVDNRNTTSEKHIFGYNDYLQRTTSENELNGVERTFTYTDRGQLKSETLDYDTVATNNPEFTTSYEYDDHGRIAKIIYPSSGNDVSYTYTEREELKTVDWSPITSGSIETRSYDPAGRLTDIDRLHFDEQRTYDAANRLLSISNLDPSVSSNADQVGKISYGYDLNGNKQSETWTDGPAGMTDWNFTTIVGSGTYSDGYDEEDRLRRFNRSGTIVEANASVYLDRDVPTGAGGTIGNIKSSSGWTASGSSYLNGARTYSNIYELESIGASFNLSYDIDGQLKTMDNNNDLVWDPSGRLQQVDNGSDDYTYGYDCDGRRVWKKKVGDTSFTVFCYGGPNVISEFTIATGTPDTAQLDKEYVYGTTIDELLLVDLPVTTARLQASRRGVTRNQQWSIMSIYDMASGDITGRFNYDVFGKRFVVNADGSYGSNQNEDFEIPYGYTSRRHDPESSLMYFRARYFDNSTGEFISPDPTEYVDGMSLYRGYFLIDAVDPQGKLRLISVRRPEWLDCGGLIHTAKWKLTGRERNGYVIQQICAYGERKQCPGEEPVPCENIFNENEEEGRTCSGGCYLELWEVKNRQAVEPAVNLEDTFSFPSCDRTYGSYSAYGTAIFVPNTWIDDNNLQEEIDKFKDGASGVESAGVLRSVCLEDVGVRAFWRRALSEFGKKGTGRFSLASWNCCCGKKEWIRRVSRINYGQ